MFDRRPPEAGIGSTAMRTLAFLKYLKGRWDGDSTSTLTGHLGWERQYAGAPRYCIVSGRVTGTTQGLSTTQLLPSLRITDLLPPAAVSGAPRVAGHRGARAEGRAIG